ncbi:MAG: metallophosphoesterase [Limisphaerales bacterium]
MKLKSISRRKFLLTAMLATPLALGADATGIEPTWLKVRRVRIGNGAPVCKLAHFSDVHYKGDREYLQTVVDNINSLTPDFACFTGDLVERREHLDAALEILSGLKVPLFGVPGNHDFWSGISFNTVKKRLVATGGDWLMDGHQEMAGGKVNVIGASCLFQGQRLPPANPLAKNILLMHYPAWAKKLGDRQFDLLLAGHSHGGQVRIPFYGSLVVPFNVDEYDMGLFQTAAGPLYVNPGIGYIGDYNFRFNCRPEITVIEV